jgi:hypothetical protein
VIYFQNLKMEDKFKMVASTTILYSLLFLSQFFTVLKSNVTLNDFTVTPKIIQDGGELNKLEQKGEKSGVATKYS